MGENLPLPARAHRRAFLPVLWYLLLAAVLLLGGYFRFVGLNWDENQHLHPDERFLTMVAADIRSIGTAEEALGTPPAAEYQTWRLAYPDEFPDCPSWGGYFHTACSSLNPNNRGYPFYVYGTLPLFAVRYAGEWLGKTGYDEIHLVGRQFSAAMDLATIALVYLIAARLYRRRPLALLAAGFAAFSVLPIQLSHYFTVDTFTNFFGMLALLFAVLLLPAANRPEDGEARISGPGPLAVYLLFGLALGLAAASKINAALLAALLPGAALIRYFALDAEARSRSEAAFLRNLILAALVSLVVFRVFQPYAFTGPGFLDIKPSAQWIATMRSLANQSTGDVDFPPALQWARRPISFSFTNMVVWGLGLPLGLLAWAGFLWMGYRIFRGERRQHLLIWLWTGLYFAYQSLSFVRSMRYQMLVYPTLAIIAAWAAVALWDHFSARHREQGARKLGSFGRVCAVLVGVGVLLLTAGYAFAFTRIYTRPVTRVEASRWIYQNVPGPINLRIETDGGAVRQPVAYQSGAELRPGQTLSLAFRPRRAGQLAALDIERLGSQDYSGTIKSVLVAVSTEPDGSSPLAAAVLENTFLPEDDPRGSSYQVNFDRQPELQPEQTYYLVMSMAGGQETLNIAGSLVVTFYENDGLFRQALPEPVFAMRAGQWYQITFTPVKAGILNEVTLEHVVDWEGRPEEKNLRVSIFDAAGGELLGSAAVSADFAALDDVRGERYVFALDRPVALDPNRSYKVRVEHVSGPGALAVYGSRQAIESTWDDALPLSLDGYNPYDYSFGVYRSELNFEMYWPDNADKLQRFLTVLDQADYLFLSSNRQWGTTVRVPERYPLTTLYYRSLLGCPPEREITWCYSVAQPGMFNGSLGFELAAVFQSDPNLGGLRFNTQFAEEAFTVYDAPKVMIFKKTGAYDPDRVAEILGSVDLSKVIYVTPRQASKYPANLMLPPDRLAGQRAGGTWAELFPPDSLVNRYPALAALVWYLVIALLGIVMLPFTRLALRGLPDRGYPFARLVGLLALSYLVWLSGSAGAAFTPASISPAFAVLVGINFVIGYRERKTLALELRDRGRYFLMIELLFLAFFLLFLIVRLVNPDLWHTWRGGERPMDFSYLNAVLKSSTFPPYDPWFAGGYINYYYYGFVLIGAPVKWLGITPSVAYNLILPTWFALLALGAFSIGWNLLVAARPRFLAAPAFGSPSIFERWGAFAAGLASALALVFIGNWGTVRMIWHGMQRLNPIEEDFAAASLITHLRWTFQGLGRMIAEGARIPFAPGDWYWTPSRALPGWTITEFPAFTFLYGDPHAHLIALPLTVLALAWALAVVLGRWGWKGWGHLSVSFCLGGLVIGALKPTNTWDWPTYMAIAVVAVAYTTLRYGQACCMRIPGLNPRYRRFVIAFLAVGSLVAISWLLFRPYDAWYGSGYDKIIPWDGARSPFWSYMTHWGVFLFILVSWMAWESAGWLAANPLSALRPGQRWLWLAGAAVVLAASAWLLSKGVTVGWLAVLLMGWAGALLLRRNIPDARRAVLFLTGTAIFLTLFVEVARLEGDLERMNTVFKFYLQAWTLFALSAGTALVWLLPEVGRSWRPGLQRFWQAALVVLLFGAALYPVMAAMDKMTDRMGNGAPLGLDGMTYMAYSIYDQVQPALDLSQDYRAIRWMQQNVTGSPVIVEAHQPEYHWGNRFTIYTGLPGVIGWNWHQRQQRAVTPPEWVTDRIKAVELFYNTTSRVEVEKFLRRYDVSYIIVGGLEMALYSPAGLQKFDGWNGDLWKEVYRDGETAIYAVIK